MAAARDRVTDVGRPPAPAFPMAAWSVVLAVLVAVTAAMTWTTFRSYRDTERFADERLELSNHATWMRTSELQFVMLARLFVETGEESYRRQYADLDAQWRRRVADAVGVVDDARLRREIDAANAGGLRLYEIESSAFDLADAGHRSAARRVLEGREYGRGVHAVTGHVEAAAARLDALAARTNERQVRRSAVATTAFAVLVIVVMWIVALAMLRRWGRAIEAANDDLAEVLREHDSILASAAEGICGIDLDGRITFANDAAAQMLGASPPDLVGRSEHNALHAARPDGSTFPASECPIASTLTQAGEVSVSHDVFRRADGSAIDVGYSARSLVHDGELVGSVLVFRDISREMQAQHLKDEFIATVSHELRTPLTSIRGYVELMREEGGELSADQLRFMRIVERNVDRLQAIVEDLLLVAQIESGTLSLDLRPVDLAQLAADSIATAHVEAARRGVELVARAGDEPVLVLGDRSRLGQVLDNLVSNAVKFTPAGGGVEVAVDRADAARPALVVADTGIGIPAAEQAHVFERFFRSKDAARMAIPGSGIGLALARGIVQAHGGEISLESEVGHGTTMRVELPLAPPGAAVGDAPPQPGPSRHPRRSPEERSA